MNFKDLKIWQKSMLLVEEIFTELHKMIHSFEKSLKD